ncbi:drug/metabolite transporter (DMT)-like permease [Actinoplanes lutulentus]|uniref:EamA-like transporter family protein n=1 Tax=Actinoplanes lutulentus TaxID=1287878 RepID=A0A327ZPD5_9ACTN|nr:EamA family transporter [Actinoplanes lutulentus]MBB2944309.1 drug/metabolite transporter (DMT)-like permease [Actinoplanes lutulentus]RAK42458.1 EamA-like transporter family protein [Actinoplanes lutulentus]
MVETLALAGLAAVAWGSSDFVAGICARRIPIRTVLIGSKVAGMLFAVVFLALRPWPLPTGNRLILMAAAAGAIGIPAMGLLYRAMRDGSLTVVAPVAAGAALVPVGWGIFQGSIPGLATAVGAVAALAGITLASWPVTTNRSADPGGDGSLLVRVTSRRVSALCATGAALGFGTYFVLLHEAAPDDPYAATGYARIAGGLAALLLLVLWRPSRGVASGDRGRPAWSLASGDRGRPALVWLLPVVVGVLDTVADGAFAFSAAAGTIGTAAILASMYPAVTVLLNTTVLRERLPHIHLVGVLTALLAVACLAQ